MNTESLFKKLGLILVGLMMTTGLSLQAQTNTLDVLTGGSTAAKTTEAQPDFGKPPEPIMCIEVQPGDTCYSLCRRFKVSLELLKIINPGLDPDHLSIGQKLNLPPGGNLTVKSEPDALTESQVAEANAQLTAARAKGEAWTKDPLQIALHFAGEDLQSVAGWERAGLSLFIKHRNPQVEIIIQTEGEWDDCIASEKTVVVLEPDGFGHWKLIRQASGTAHWPGRGSTSYTSKPGQ